jgi:hypothetical protein
MKFLTKKSLLSISLFFILLSIAVAIYNHQTISSAFIAHSDFIEIQKNIFVSPDTTKKQQALLLTFIKQGKNRIRNKFGSFTANPVIISSTNPDKLKPYTNNHYGVTKITLFSAYIIIGSKGQSLDVISHELLHSELFTRIGFLNRWFKVPIWFDEGIAMQVDSRKGYNKPVKNTPINSLRYGWQFFRGDVQNHYALAKHEVAQWLKNTGDREFYKLLTDINNGHSFSEAYSKFNKSTQSQLKGEN